MSSGRNGSGDPEVGARIRAIRKSKLMTLKDLASKAGIEQPNLSRLENGQVGFSSESIRRIARALDVPVSDLFQPQSPGQVFWVPFVNDPDRPMFPSGHPVSGAAFALEVTDPALLPLIQPGDIVICDFTPFSEGRAVVAKHGDDLIVRKVRTLIPANVVRHSGKDENGDEVWGLDTIRDTVYELYADNDRVPRIEVPPESAKLILGTVVQRITRMLHIPRMIFPRTDLPLTS